MMAVTITLYNSFQKELMQGLFDIGGGLTERGRVILAFICAGKDTPAATDDYPRYEWGSKYVPNWQPLAGPKISLSGTKATLTAQNMRFFKTDKSATLTDFTHGIIFMQTERGSTGPLIGFFPVSGWSMYGSGYKDVEWPSSGIFSIDIARP